MSISSRYPLFSLLQTCTPRTILLMNKTSLNSCLTTIRLSSFISRHSSLKKRPFPHAWAMHPFLRRTFAPEF